MINEDRKAESDVRIWKNNPDILISKQSAMTIAGWWHGGQTTRAYSFASSGVVQPDADMSDYCTRKEYEYCSQEDRNALDALMAYMEAEKAIRHGDIPHRYGTQADCSECLATCHCYYGQTCVFCEYTEPPNGECGCTDDGSWFCLPHQEAIAEFYND